MRFSTVISLIVSILLAALAVYGVRVYLDNQRTMMARNANGGDVSANTIVVADKPLRFGQLIRDEDVRELPWPSKIMPAGAFKSKSEIVGKDDKARYVMSPIEKDEPILTSKITGPGQRATLSAALTTGMKAMSIRVNDVLGVSGFVLPGDRVDVLLTRHGNDGAYVDVLLQGVKVLAINQNADERSDKPNVSKTVTFEVTTEEAQKLTLASQIGTLSLALRNIASNKIESIQPVTISDLGGAPVSKDLESEVVKKQDDRLGKIETLVKNVGSNLENRIGSVEEKLNEKSNKVPVEKPDPVIVATPKPKYAVIGVSRDGNRNEYRVPPAE